MFYAIQISACDNNDKYTTMVAYLNMYLIPKYMLLEYVDKMWKTYFKKFNMALDPLTTIAIYEEEDSELKILYSDAKTETLVKEIADPLYTVKASRDMIFNDSYVIYEYHFLK